MAAEPFESLPLSATHTRQVALLPWHHRDPFDRMLVAQAQAENLILLTADDYVTAYGGFVRLVR
jgi:PIN domain nuclease of toxin-antitoxin system